jgi:hypothetical protein
MTNQTEVRASNSQRELIEAKQLAKFWEAKAIALASDLAEEIKAHSKIRSEFAKEIAERRLTDAIEAIAVSTN